MFACHCSSALFLPFPPRHRNVTSAIAISLTNPHLPSVSLLLSHFHHNHLLSCASTIHSCLYIKRAMFYGRRQSKLFFVDEMNKLPFQFMVILASKAPNFSHSIVFPIAVHAPTALLVSAVCFGVVIDVGKCDAL